MTGLRIAHPAPALDTPDDTVGVFHAALWFAMAGGIVQACLAALMRYDLERYTHLSRQVIWSAPVSAACVLSIPASIAWLLHRRRPSPALWRGALAFHAALSVLGIQYYLSGVHPLARFTLAAGCGVAIARLVGGHRAAFSTLVRRTLPLMIIAIALTAVILNGGRALSERQKIASLPPSTPDAPNVLLLILDTVRALDLSLYGYDRETTPEIARFATRGVTFDRAYAAAPWTLPSHSAMFTGRSPHELSADWRVPLDDSFPTLAEVLSQRGYLTTAFVGNLAYASTESGLDRGFAHYEGFLVTIGNVLASGMLAHTVSKSESLRRLLDWHELVERKPAGEINRRAIDWLAEHPGKPWFAFLNYYDAHDPYLPPPPYDTAFTGRVTPSSARNYSLLHALPVTPAQARAERDAYDQSIRWLDHQVGSFLAEMERRGLLRNTIVVIASDHGEEFGEHGLLSHGSSLYLPALHVPLVIVAPGRVPATHRVSHVVSLRDLAATVLDLTGTRPALPGRSLRSAWTGTALDETAIAEVRYAPRVPKWFPANRGDMSAVIAPTHELIRDGHGTLELFDLTADSTGAVPDSSAATANRLEQLLPSRPR